MPMPFPVAVAALATAFLVVPTVVSTQAETETIVWVTGDACMAFNRTTDCAEVGALIAADSQRDAVLLVGDGQYDTGSLSAYRTYYDPKMGNGPGLKAITYPVPGNHEYKTPGAAGYFDYFGTRAGERSKGYYSFVLGSWRLIAANSNCSHVGGCYSSSPQGKFVRSNLGYGEKCELVFAHHPAFSDGSHGDSSAGKELFSATYHGHGELYVAGHEHNYQRFAPRRPDGTASASGVRSFVVGAGGSNLTGFATTKRSEYRQSWRFGALRLVLGSSGYRGQFIDYTGKVMDSFSGSCRW